MSTTQLAFPLSVLLLTVSLAAAAQTPKAVPGNASPQGQAVSGMTASPIPGSSTTGRASKPGGGAKHARHHRTPVKG